MLLVLLATAHAATLQVGPTRTYTAIQDAIDAASNGDSIEVDAGTYAEDLALGGLDLTINGAGSGSTVLTPTGTGIDATGGEALSLGGLTIRGGLRGVDATGELVFSDVILTGIGDGADDGAALRLVGGTLAWAEGKVDYCLAAKGVVQLEDAEASLGDVDLRYGEAAWGAGIHATDSTLSMAGGSLVYGTAAEDGGGIWASGGSTSLDGTALLGNVASDGGAISSVEGAVWLTDATFDGNSDGVWMESGGELHVEGGVMGNSSSLYDVYLYRGSAAVVEGTTFGGLVSVSAASMEFADVSLTGSVEVEGDVDLYVREGSSLTLTGSWTADELAGSLYVQVSSGGEATVDGLTFVGADAGGNGLWLQGYGGSSIELARSTFEGAALSISVASESAAATLAEIDIRDGALGIEDGGTLAGEDLFLEDSNVTIRRGTLSARHVRMSGAPANTAAITVDYGGGLLVDGLSLDGGGTSSAASGPAVTIGNGSATIHRGWFGNFNGSELAGAIYVDTGTLDLTTSVFFANQGVRSGAVHVADGTVTMEGIVFQDNTAEQGAALYVDGAFPVVRNVTAVGNAATDGGVFHIASGYANLVDVIASDSEAGWGFYAASSSSAGYSSVEYSDAWNNADGDYGGAFSVLTGDDGNIAEDPRYVSWTEDDSQLGDDLHLVAPDSPCIDAGYPGWSDPDGTVIDIGAFGGEYGVEYDFDGDLQLPSEGDCDDSDATTYDGAEEIPGDGADNDCAGDGDEPLGDGGSDDGGSEDGGASDGGNEDGGEDATDGGATEDGGGDDVDGTHSGRGEDDRLCGCEGRGTGGTWAALVLVGGLIRRRHL